MASPQISHLVGSEFRRLLDWRGLLMAMGMAGLGFSTIRIPKSMSAPVHGVWSTADKSLTLGVVVTSILLAGALAEDRRTGYTRLVLARGYSRRAYVLAKALAVALGAGSITLLGLMGFLALARIRLPLDAWVMATALDFLYPLVILPLTASGLTLTGLLYGVFSKNPYVASAVPLIVLVASAWLMRHSHLSPAVHVDSWRLLAMPRPFAPSIGFALLYWIVFGALVALASGEVFARTEEV